MNLNDFVVLPNNKAKSVKLNARNLQALQMETVTLAQESREMEEKLQQLKESMSKEKEERGHSGGFKWKSGQCGSLNSSALTNSTKKNKENRLQKLSAGKMKIRVLKDEPLTGPPQPPAPPPPIGPQATRKNRLRGTYCGQCEVKTAGIMCAECTEHYCIGCFTKFHQKGALKHHRMIPIQTDLQTHVSTRDVVSCFQEQINPSSHPGTFADRHCNSKPGPNSTLMSNATTSRGDQSPEKGTEAVAKPIHLHCDPSQVLPVNRGEEKKVEMIEDRLKSEYEKGHPASLLRGEFSEEESARSFQEALKQWRGEMSSGAGEPTSEDTMWIPVRPVSVSAMATQADLTPDGGAEGRGRGGGEGRIPVRVEFKENSLTYMDRLLLKKHRRTPIEVYRPSLAFVTDLRSLPNSEAVPASSLTAQEEDFRRYCASLFAVPVSRSRTEPQITTPESCLVIEVLDEGDTHKDGVFYWEQKTDNNRKVPSVQQALSKGKTLVPSGGFPRVSCSSPSPAQSKAPAQDEVAQRLHRSKPQTSQAEHSMKSLSSKSRPNCSPSVHKSKSDHRPPQRWSSPSLPRSLTEIHKSSLSSAMLLPHVSTLASARAPIQEEHPSPSSARSFSLRSTFTVSPSSSTESTLLPKVYQSASKQKCSGSSLLPEKPQSSQLFPEQISSPRLSHSPPNNLESPRQSQLCDPESPPSDNQLLCLPLSPVSSSPNPVSSSPTSLESSPPVTTLSHLSLFMESPPGAYSAHRSTPTHKAAPVFMSSTPISHDHESTLLHQDTQHIPSLPLHLLNVIQDTTLGMNLLEEDKLSMNSGDEMSSDSLGLVPQDEDSSDEEAQVHGHLTGVRSSGEDNPAMSHLEDFFVPPDAETEKDMQTDEQEQLSEPSMVRQSAVSGSGQACDLDGFPSPGLDLNSGHSDIAELYPSQTSSYDSDPTGSEGYGPSSSLSPQYTEEHLVFRVMKDNHMQPTGIQIHSTTPTRRGEISANEPGTSGSESCLSVRSMPTLSPSPRTNESHLPAPVSLPSGPGPVFRPLSQAAQEIMEICSVDQTGCEDPDLDTDTTAQTLQGLEQELSRLMAKETEQQASVFGMGNCVRQEQRRFIGGRVSEEQKDEEAAAQRDRQSVLSLP